MLRFLATASCRAAPRGSATIAASSSATLQQHRNGLITSPNTKRFKSTRMATVEEESDDPFLVEIPQQAVPLAEASVSSESFLNVTNHREQPSTMTYTGGAEIPITSSLHIVTPQEDQPRGTWPVFRMMDEDGCFRDPSYDGLMGENGENVMVEERSAPFQSTSSFEGSAFLSHLQQAHPSYTRELQDNELLHPLQDHHHSKTAASSFAGLVETHDVEEKHLPMFLRAHRHMVRLREMDQILLNAQRQGRISFYMTCTGEEAIHMGAASALSVGDPVFAQYREQGVLQWRGFTLEQFTNQCFSNDKDLGKGRQMPIHYGSRALSYHTVSSPLGTQIPQASGAAYRLKLQNQQEQDPSQKQVAICFFGDGSASTTDFHSGLNFAATLGAPVLFFCRNNGYAISTPVTDQYAGDGVVCRATGYGMAGIRVDGNDVFAVHAAVREARRYALEHSAPVLIEAMTYRQGHHSTSDDSTRYRDANEVDRFADTHDPVQRLENFMIRHGWLTSTEAERMRENERLAVLQAMESAEQRAKPPLTELFTDVYRELPPHLQEQQAQLKQHLAKYPDRYSRAA